MKTYNPTNKKGKVFVIGDSRTGTTTIHNFLKAAGFNSIHYFFKESSVSEPAHINFEENWVALKHFIDSSEFNAFSDYPLRTFYKKLFETYPNAHFILTTRKNIDTWKKSMLSFFGKFNIELDIDSLTKTHIKINEDIQQIANSIQASFCKICIDDDSSVNGKTLSTFLSLDTPFSLGHENSTKAYDNDIWSSKVTFYNTKDSDYLSYIKNINYPSKAMLSEYGWLYLINDSSGFLNYLYDDACWHSKDLDSATKTLSSRLQHLSQKGISYLKFIIPEKSVVYPQYLPKIFDGKKQSKCRPAEQLKASKLDFCYYPLQLLKDSRSYGHVYFRGDSHPNWLGAYFIYYYIIQKLNANLSTNHPNKKQKKAFHLGELEQRLAAYDGDLYSQLDPELKLTFKGAWQPIMGGEKLETLVQYVLPLSKRKAKPLAVEQNYLDQLKTRETFRFTHSDKSLPKAVIFRDSTADFFVEMLAEHFSESLFIWKGGHVFSDVIEKEKPDIILHVMAERFLVQYSQNSAFNELGV